MEFCIYKVLIIKGFIKLSGGETGIRTLDRLSTYTPLAGERFRPLSHLSEKTFIYILIFILTLVPVIK